MCVDCIITIKFIRHNCDANNSQLEPDYLHQKTAVNLPIREGFICAFREKC